VAYDLATGFGLVRTLLPLRGIAPVPLGSTGELEPGENLMAATGNEGGEVGLTRLVGKRPFTGYWEYHIDGALFTSPPLQNHSGAALFNRRGELLGIGSLFVRNALGDALPLPGNMFVPVDLLKPILGELIAQGRRAAPPRPWLGLNTDEVRGRLFVARVSPEGPAERAGLRENDLVLAVGPDEVSSLADFYRRVWSRGAAGIEVPLKVLRGMEVRDVRIRSMDRMQYFKPSRVD
jgi:S1-C subfamily serine protease